MLRKLLTRTLLILMGMFFALVILEILLRFYPIPNRFALNRQQLAQWQSDDELLLHIKPNLNLRITAHPEFSYTIRTNSQGLRDEEVNGRYDLIALGDSFTFGFGVENEEAWPQQLAAISGQRVANLGWAGWNSYVYPRTIQRHVFY